MKHRFSEKVKNYAPKKRLNAMNKFVKKHIANLITCCRILCSILMMFFPAFSVPFYIAYLICGLSDIADGPIARKTGSACVFGARLDTVADFVFVLVSLVKILPHMKTRRNKTYAQARVYKK